MIRLAEGLITSVVGRVLEQRRTELQLLERDTSKLEEGDGAVSANHIRRGGDSCCKEKGQPFEYGDDLGGGDETVLSEHFDRPVCVTHYPAAVKAFYMKPDPQQPDKALCVDVLAPEGYGEIIGGGQREDDLELLEQRIREHNLPQEAFEWYLDLRRYGTRASRRFRHGHRAMRVVDLRARARARDDSVPENVVSAVSVGSGSRLRLAA